MVFPSKELGQLLGCTSIFRFFSTTFLFWLLPCDVVLTVRALFASWTPYLTWNLFSFLKSQNWATGSLGRAPHLATHKQTLRSAKLLDSGISSKMVALNLSGSKKFQPRPQGLLLDDFQNGGSSGEDPGTQHKSRDRFVHGGWKFIQNGSQNKEWEDLGMRCCDCWKTNKMAARQTLMAPMCV